MRPRHTCKMAEPDRTENHGPWTGLGLQAVPGIRRCGGRRRRHYTVVRYWFLDVAITAAFRDAVTEALLLATAAAVVVAVVASLFVTRRIVGPLQRLASASQRIANGHYAERVPVTSRDELGDVARSFNAMASALETTERRRRELLGDVAHELR